jgi:spore coat protein A
MFQIGTDSGFMEKPISIQSITLAPAERADIIVDFSTLAGKTITLKNNAPAGFPSGKPPEAETTGSVMQFRVTKPLSGKNYTVIPPVLGKIHWLTEQSVDNVRYLELGETKDQFGRKVMLLDNKKWDSPISENPIAGTVEIWNLINTTQDDHPIHLHLVQFQILDRRPFDVKMFKNTGKIKFTGSPILPKRQEKGWKDVSQSPPGMITRIIVPFFPYTGLYVWHCHMLEHEDYEMMRPYQVLPP